MVRKWTEREKKYVEENREFKTISQLVKGLRALNAIVSQPPRSYKSLVSYLWENYGTTLPTEDNLLAYQFAKNLGVSGSTVINWIKKYNLPATIRKSKSGSKVYRSYYCVSLENFKKWSKENKNLLKGLNYENLLWALDDPELAKELSSVKYRTGQKIKLLRIKGKDKKSYPNVTQAAKDSYITQQGLTRAIRVAISKDQKTFESSGYQWLILN